MTYKWWQLRGVKGQIKQYRILQHGRVYSSSFDGILNFEEVKELDEGRYLVEARNSLGVALFELSFHVLCEYHFYRL